MRIPSFHFVTMPLSPSPPRFSAAAISPLVNRYLQHSLPPSCLSSIDDLRLVAFRRRIRAVSSLLLARLMHALLRRHGISALRLLLLLLEVGLILHGLLVGGSHVGLRTGVARHAGLGH